MSIHGISREAAGGQAGDRVPSSSFQGESCSGGRARENCLILTNATGPTDATGPSVLDWWMEVGTKGPSSCRGSPVLASGESDAVNLWKVLNH